ncbi:MAG: beta-ketoacyl-ACP synthase [bacterium]|nr:beta-ketoacyl-ACP synthase [bacterium]
MNNRRVVVTGIGLYSPLGNSVPELSENLRSGKSGIVQMPEWDKVDKLRTKIGGICGNFDEKEIPRNFRRTMGRVAILGALAARDAVKDSGLGENLVASPRCGVSFGSTEGSTGTQEKFMDQIFSSHSIKGVPSSLYLQIMSHTCAANIAMMFGTKGPVIASCTACVSGSQGIGYGYEAIQGNKADIMVTGGAEESHFMNAVVFDLLRATSAKFNDAPHLTPKPFDVDRDGLVVSEGGGCLILEEYEHAKKRGAHIYAEILGFGSNCDGEHLTNPSETGMAGAMRLSLEDANLSPDKIGHVNAHATATEAGDIAESKATFSIFKDEVPVTGFKGYMGHSLGACGAIESIISILMMRDGFIAPTKNLENPDPVCAPIKHVIGECRDYSFDVGMNNNFAFGGINTSLIFGLV